MRRSHAYQEAVSLVPAEWEPTDLQLAYNEGRSTQVPVNPAVRVKGRFSRHLRCQDTELRLERGTAQFRRTGKRPDRKRPACHACDRCACRKTLVRSGYSSLIASRNAFGSVNRVSGEEHRNSSS